jgi:glycosyltransferase
MKISVVTVCLNSEKTIAFMIRSFLMQRYPNKELLIIDGASRDRTVEIASSFTSPDIRIVSEKDHGIYDAMNKGLRLFGGDAIGFIGSDDTLHDERSLDHIANALVNADIVYGDLDMVRDHNAKQVARVWKSGEFRREAFLRGWMPAHATFYVRRKVVETVGEFDLSYDIGADYDLILRSMMLHQFRMQYVPQVLVDFQLGGTSSRGLRSALHQNIECLRARRRHLGAPVIDLAFFLKPARKILQFRMR